MNEEKSNLIEFDSIDWGFIEWLDRGMWSNHEREGGKVVARDFWYNTYRLSAMKNPLTKEQLYEKYKSEKDNQE